MPDPDLEIRGGGGGAPLDPPLGGKDLVIRVLYGY